MTISLFSLSSFAQLGVAGKWTFVKQNNIVEITQKKGVYTGKLIASGNPKAKKGMVIVRNLKKTLAVRDVESQACYLERLIQAVL